jgi:hypothetical protein
MVNVPALLNRFTTAACNQFGHDYPVDALFSFDDCVGPDHLANELFLPNWVTKDYGTKIIIKSAQKQPYPTCTKKNGQPVYAFQLFTTSLALQWALWQKPSAIYLVGVDHVETDTTFKHYYGQDGQSKLTPTAHQLFKKYAQSCGRIIPVYQTNKAVASQWPVPYKPLDSLYDFPTKTPKP